MSITLLPTPPSRQDPTNFAVRADEFLGALPVFATETNALAAQVNTNALSASTNASTSTLNASAAATSASNAALSASAASTSASNAALSASNASSSAISAANNFNSFDDRYLGAKSSPPTVDNSGDALIVGAVYWNSTTNSLAIWTGVQWNPAAVTITSGVNTFNTRIGNITLTAADVTGVLNSSVNLTAGVITATDFNSTSDANLKTNVQPIDPKLLQAIRPVSFDWKNTGEKSYGVIAQELQQVLPELVQSREDGLLGVSYIPIIALLVQAVQELQATVSKLEQK